MSSRPVPILLEDIQEAIEKIGRYTTGLQRQAFLDDEKTADAVVRNLEIIGEAANRLPAEFHALHSEIDWRKIIGLRHRIVHDDFGADLEIVWNILQAELPAFARTLATILASASGQ
ncbi:MAG: DUF86 domain-containing protein [Candidatus Wallbacteria bacterium]|nr:DUF86 domain-containing protein [Candidatus Wallbacteria bacterium]